MERNRNGSASTADTGTCLIIGAMLIAPLMGPIIKLGMGLATLSGQPILSLPAAAVGWPGLIALGVAYVAMAYLLLGSAPIEGRLSGVVDIPNSCATVYIPTAIFDFPVAPSASGPYQIDPGMGAPHASF